MRRSVRGHPTFRLLLALMAMTAVARTGAAQWPPKMANLEVLPKDITVDSLVSVMGGFTRALGVRCSFCHVGEEERPLATYDFAADDKVTKRKARAMLRMVQRINDVDLAALEGRSDPPLRVQCVTCHHGQRRPLLLQDVLLQALRDGGVDSVASAYQGLRTRYYGRFVYDFSEVPLADVAEVLVARDSLAAARRLDELNVQSNPGSAFARRQLGIVALLEAFLAGPARGDTVYQALTIRFGAPPVEDVLNEAGWELMRRGRPADALAAFRMNATAYPGSSNVYHSLGEAYVALGDVANAIRSYAKAVEIDPTNTDAADKLRKLREKGAPGSPGDDLPAPQRPSRSRR
jgi:Photosynthetic reaction centre cytochrome C subunit/Tetratricopeptide repeat